MKFLALIIFGFNTALASPFVKSLNNARTADLNSLITPPTVAVVFQENCNSCQKQDP